MYKKVNYLDLPENDFSFDNYRLGEFLNQFYNGPNFCQFVTPLFQKTFKILSFFTWQTLPNFV